MKTVICSSHQTVSDYQPMQSADEQWFRQRMHDLLDQKLEALLDGGLRINLLNSMHLAVQINIRINKETTCQSTDPQQ